FQENAFSESEKKQAEPLLAADRYPIASIRTRDGFELVPGNDSIRLSKALQTVLEPVLFASGPTYGSSVKGTHHLDTAKFQLHVTPGGLPVVWGRFMKGQNAVEQYAYVDGQFVSTTHSLDLTRKNIPLLTTSMDWTNGKSYQPYYYSYAVDDFNPGYAFRTASMIFAASEKVSNANLSAILVFQSNTSAGRIRPDNPNTKDKSEANNNAYAVNALTPASSGLNEPPAGRVLSALVPYQEFRVALPVSTESAPSLSVTSSPSVASASVVRSKDGKGWDAVVRVAARDRVSGGVLDVPPVGVTGSLDYSVDGKDQSVEFVLSPVHVVPRTLAFAAPSTFEFFMDKNGKTVSGKKVFLVNNYPQAVTLSCGSVFSQKVDAHSVAAADVAPVEADCEVTIDGRSTEQVVSVKKTALPSNPAWSQDDVLTEPLTGMPASFEDCASGYCNCGQARAALSLFEQSANAFADRINTQGTRETVQALYPDGMVQKTVLLTGTFDDVDGGRLAACKAVFGGYTLELAPGQTYEITRAVPAAGGRLFP
ncbi:MAG: hypothetical protein Q8P02_03000, partial [Candidatus Micrarchaeota archaeon]|nr:hypothetical protein [Candidatus Micrarchaeota archaeon]